MKLYMNATMFNFLHQNLKFYILQFGKSENLVQSKLGLKKHTLKNPSVFN